MPDPILNIQSLDAHYGDFQALYDLNMTVSRGRGSGDHRREWCWQDDAVAVDLRPDPKRR